jgi:peptidoglycan/xylan/chitin deacetylase (PgdA/CDA1 family)
MRDFTAQIEALARAGYRGVTLSASLASLITGESHEKCVAMTFDDGYASVKDAAAVLKEHGFAATVFVISDHVGKDNRWRGQSPHVPTLPLLTWDQLGELAELGWEVGAHTRTHPPLTEISPTQAEDEIAASGDAIREKLGVRVTSFAYPYGAVNADVRTITERHFDISVTTRLGVADREDDRLLLKRIDSYYLSPARIESLDAPIYWAVRNGLRQVKRVFVKDWAAWNKDV